MSYNFSITRSKCKCPSCKGCDNGEDVLDVNYTSNVGGMFDLAMDGGWYKGKFHHLNEVKCSDAIPILEKAIQYFTDNREALKQLNPPNGWGNYGGAKETLEMILAAARKYPDETIKNWY